MAQTLLLLALLAPGLQESGDLEASVRQYWDLIQSGQRDEASRFVLSECRQHFEARRESPFLSWRLSSISEISPSSAEVVVSATRLIQGGLFDQRVLEIWSRTDSGWKVRVEDPVQSRKALWQGSGVKPEKGRLQVLPDALRIHFLDPARKDSLVISNGLGADVKVLSIDFDTALFELVGDVRSVEAGSTGRLTLKYLGESVEKNQESRITLVLQNRSEVNRVEMPVIYNYVSPGARGLFGLSEESAAKLRRSAPLAAEASKPKR